MSTWLRLHAHALGEAIGRLSRQPLASLVSILVLATALALPVVAAVALRSVGTAASSIDTEPHVNVYLELDATDEDAKRVERALKGHADAASVRFVPREEALADLKATTHLAEVLAALDRNPLPHAFTVRIRSGAVDRIDAMRAEWSRLPRVEQVRADFEWSRQLGRWTVFAGRALAIGWAMLGLAVLFIVAHLIRLQVVTRREEIEVSRLIGATAADVRRPFLYHGLVQGLLAGAAALALSGGLAAWAGAEVQALTSAYANEFKVLFLSPVEVIWALCGAATLGFAGAWAAVTSEIRAAAAAR